MPGLAHLKKHSLIKLGSPAMTVVQIDDRFQEAEGRATSNNRGVQLESQTSIHSSSFLNIFHCQMRFIEKINQRKMIRTV